LQEILHYFDCLERFCQTFVGHSMKSFGTKVNAPFVVALLGMLCLADRKEVSANAKEFQELSHKLGTPGLMSPLVQGGALAKALHEQPRLRGPLGARKVGNTRMKKFDADVGGFLEIGEVDNFAKHAGLSSHDAKVGIHTLDLDDDGGLSELAPIQAYSEKFADVGALPLKPGQTGRCWFHSQAAWKQDQLVFQSLGGIVGQCENLPMPAAQSSEAQLCDCTAPSDPQKFNQRFLEMGAVDGQMLSNSLFFEAQMGWTGLLVEANPTLFQQLQAGRPKSVCLHALIGNSVGETRDFFTFQKNSWEVMMSCMQGVEGNGHCANQATAQQYAKDIDAQLITTKVEFKRLTDELREHDLSALAWASIDVEGAEPYVFSTLDLKQISVNLTTYEGSYASVDEQLIENGFQKCQNSATIDSWWASKGLACP